MESLTPAQSQRADELLAEARRRAPGDRERFVRKGTDDQVIVARVLSTLHSETPRSTGSPFDETADMAAMEDTPGDGTSAPPAPRSKRIGAYTIKRTIASGGMGTVYEAIQEHPRRTVALKIMKRGIASRSALRRFEYESQILARLRHAGIAQVYESGTHDDGHGEVPYFVMEYVPNARPITDYVEQQGLAPDDALALFARVCDAVHHGHQKGIIHRDLKPPNILVDSLGDPKVIDFGVARATDSDLAVTTLQTEVGQLVGTVQYMSPEQCEADPHDLDTRSDVYALGIVLYELMCGRLPYDVTQFKIYEAARVIREHQPARLSTLDARLRGDVETIVLKALEKDRNRRYDSAGALARDIRRYLEQQPILARPATLRYHIRVFARRNKLAVGAAAAVVLALVVGVVGLTWGLVESNRSRLRAEHEAERAVRASEFLRDLLSIANPYVYAGGPEVTVVELLDEAAEQVGERFADEPQIEGQMRHTLGITYRNVGRYDAAERQIVRAVELLTSELGPEHPDTLRVRGYLGSLRGDQGRRDESEARLREVLEAQTRLLGVAHPDTLATVNSIGWTLYNAGRAAEAEPLFAETLRLRREVLGEAAPETLRTMTNLAVARIELGKLAEAETPARQAAEIMRGALGPRHPDSIYATHIRAWWLWRNGELEAAMELYTPLIEDARAVFGTAHPHTLYWTAAVVELLIQLRRFEQAETLGTELLRASRETFGDEHIRVRNARRLLAELYEAWDKPELAARYQDSAS